MFNTFILQDYTLEERTDIYLSGPIMVNNKLLITSSNGVVYIVSASNGIIEHTIDTKNNLPYAPISANDTVIFVNSDADIIAYREEGKKYGFKSCNNRSPECRKIHIV